MTEPKPEPKPDPNADAAAHAEQMRRLQAERRAERRTKTETGGLLIVHTGDGKGKSTAGFGMVLRCLGWGMRPGVVQFIKGKWKTGERQYLSGVLGADYVVSGEGFTWDSQDQAADIAAAERGWDAARAMLADPAFDLVLLDELNIALRYGHLPVDRVLADLAARPAHQHVCVTGRDARPELIAAADLVTRFDVVRHPYAEGYRAQKGVEF